MSIFCGKIEDVKASRGLLDLILAEWKKNPVDYEQPKIFLEKWMACTQGHQRFPEEILCKDKIINRHLNTIHLSAFLGEAYDKFEKSLNDKRDYAGGITSRLKRNNTDIKTMTWKDSVDYQGIVDITNISEANLKARLNDIRLKGGDPNIYFALGNFTLVSKIELDIKESDGQFVVTIIRWTVILNDTYDFAVDSPRQFGMAIGNVFFRTGHCYEKYGFAKPFYVESSWTHTLAKKEYLLNIKH